MVPDKSEVAKDPSNDVAIQTPVTTTPEPLVSSFTLSVDHRHEVLLVPL